MSNVARIREFFLNNPKVLISVEELASIIGISDQDTRVHISRQKNSGYSSGPPLDLIQIQDANDRIKRWGLRGANVNYGEVNRSS